MLEKAKARCAKAGLSNVEFKSGDAENLPFADAQFDGAVTRAAVHHFADPQRAINEMFRVLRPGGTVVIADVIERRGGPRELWARNLQSVRLKHDGRQGQSSPRLGARWLPYWSAPRPL
jgi:ubiquinone/menaquinone biosynthesis C-methylase UbiE